MRSAHAHQHALVSIDGDGSIRGWEDTPEGQAFIKAREKDQAEGYTTARIDRIPGFASHLENAAEISALYWAERKWDGRPGFEVLEKVAPNRLAWAQAWLKKK